MKGWWTDGFSVMKNVLPVVFLALANVARNYTTTFFFFYTGKKNLTTCITQNPEYTQTQGVKMKN